MNVDWSVQNKEMQTLLKKESTFKDGIKILFELRNSLMDQMLQYKKLLKREDFDSMPFINAKGYHSKNVAYSLWHIFRIEDIVCHSMIQGDEEIFFLKDYQKKIASSIITTGNELVKDEIFEFSNKLNIQELYNYIIEVKESTEKMLEVLSYKDLRRKMSITEKNAVTKLSVVSSNEKAFWLIDYWGSKTIRGLIQMPFSRHWIMHIEACSRIITKLGISI